MKRYFETEDDSEFCYTIAHFKEEMKANGVNEMTLFEAQPDIGTDYFYCAHYFEVGMKGETPCGKLCDGYAPRNGKNGRCKHSKNCYSSNGKTITINLNQ